MMYLWFWWCPFSPESRERHNASKPAPKTPTLCCIFSVVWTLRCMILNLFNSLLSAFLKLKAKWVSLDEQIFLSWFNPAIKFWITWSLMACPAGFLTIVLLQIVFLQLLFSHFFENQMLLRNPQGKLKVKQVLIDARNFLSWVNPLSFQFVFCINMLYECVRVVFVFYDVLYCLCYINLLVLFACFKKRCVVLPCCVFVLYICCSIFVLYFCVLFLCYIFLLYFVLYFFVLYFLCCIFRDVLYKLNAFHIDIFLYCTYLDFLLFFFPDV